MARKLGDVLEEQGMSLNLQADSKRERDGLTASKGATERAAKLKRYLSADIVFCNLQVNFYWYNRIISG